MKQREQTEPEGVMIANKNDAVEWLLLAYSLDHSDDCQCAFCVEARCLAFEPLERGQPAVA